MMRNERGFTLLNIVLVVVGLSIMGTVAVQMVSNSTTTARMQKSMLKIEEIQNAIYGDPDLQETGQRSFFKDMGRLPYNLEELMYNTQSDSNWMGPYYTTSFLGEENVPTDGFGNEIQYNPESGAVALSDASMSGEIGEVVVEQPSFYGNVSGTLYDLTEETYRRESVRYLILVYMQFMGGRLLPIEYNLDTDEAVFKAFWFTEWYQHQMNDNPVEPEFDEHKHRFKWAWDYWRRYWDGHAWNSLQWNFAYWNFKNMFGSLNFQLDSFFQEVQQQSEKILTQYIATRPEEDGTYSIGHLPAGNYIITAYIHRLLIPTNSHWNNWVDTGQESEDDEDFNDDGDDDDSEYDHHHSDWWSKLYYWKKHKSEWQWGWFYRPGHGWQWGWHKGWLGNSWISRKLIKYNIERSVIKRYISVRPNQTAEANFKFNGFFIGGQPWFYVDSTGSGGGEGEGESNPESDNLLVNVQNLRVDWKDYNDLTLGNSSSNALTIDKIKVSWDRDWVSTKLKKCKIGGSSYWPGGNAESGETVDIQDATIAANSNNISFALEFTNAWLNWENITISFIMADGSVKEIDSDSDGS